VDRERRGGGRPYKSLHLRHRLPLTYHRETEQRGERTVPWLLCLVQVLVKRARTGPRTAPGCPVWRPSGLALAWGSGRGTGPLRAVRAFARVDALATAWMVFVRCKAPAACCVTGTCAERLATRFSRPGLRTGSSPLDFSGKGHQGGFSLCVGHALYLGLLGPGPFWPLRC